MRMTFRAPRCQALQTWEDRQSSHGRRRSKSQAQARTLGLTSASSGVGLALSRPSACSGSLKTAPRASASAPRVIGVTAAGGSGLAALP